MNDVNAAMTNQPDYVHGDVPLNPNIVFTVQFLQDNGFRTTDSGDGKTHECECDRDYAYVVMSCPSHRLLDEADRLMKILRGAGVNLGQISREEDIVAIQATYDPFDGTSFLEVLYLDDDHFRKLGYLE